MRRGTNEEVEREQPRHWSLTRMLCWLARPLELLEVVPGRHTEVVELFRPASTAIQFAEHGPLEVGGKASELALGQSGPRSPTRERSTNHGLQEPSFRKKKPQPHARVGLQLPLSGGLRLPRSLLLGESPSHAEELPRLPS